MKEVNLIEKQANDTINEIQKVQENIRVSMQVGVFIINIIIDLSIIFPFLKQLDVRIKIKPAIILQSEISILN